MFDEKSNTMVEIAEQGRKKIEKNKRIIKKAVKLTAILIIILSLILICIAVYRSLVQKGLNENNSFETMSESNDIKNSIDLKRENCQLYSDSTTVSAGNVYTVGIKSDGTAIVAGRNKLDVQNWDDIMAVSTGYSYAVGLKQNGTVVATDYKGVMDYSGQCNVQGWKDIIAISARGNHTVGLKSNGTVVATGNNWSGACSVQGWEDIVAISAGIGSHTVGLKSDGTVVAKTAQMYM